MFDNLSPKLKRWGSIALLIAAAIWVWFNPGALFEDNDATRPTSINQPSTPSSGKNAPARKNSNKSKIAISASETGFDYYVLALSWSPSFCASKKGSAKYQCGGNRFFSFIVHGLWPQFEKGWPSFCDTSNEKVSGKLAKSMLDIMPGHGLIRHQWKKHGTCSGLKQRAYFDKLRTAYDKIRFPAQFRLNNKYLNIAPMEVERAFQTENPGLPSDAIAVTCGKRRLKEVRICFSKSLSFKSCKTVDQNSCRKTKIIMPPVRLSP